MRRCEEHPHHSPGCAACRARTAAYIRQWRASRVTSDPPVHGASSYANYGCRCEVCKAGNAADVARRRANRKGVPDDIHGKYTTYGNWRCRCMECTEAYRIHRKAYRQRKR